MANYSADLNFTGRVFFSFFFNARILFCLAQFYLTPIAHSRAVQRNTQLP